MTSYAGTLFAAEQKSGSILTFEIASEKFLGKIVRDGDPHVAMIEQIILSSC